MVKKLIVLLMLVTACGTAPTVVVIPGPGPTPSPAPGPTPEPEKKCKIECPKDKKDCKDDEHTAYLEERTLSFTHGHNFIVTRILLVSGIIIDSVFFQVDAEDKLTDDDFDRIQGLLNFPISAYPRKEKVKHRRSHGWDKSKKHEYSWSVSSGCYR